LSMDLAVHRFTSSPSTCPEDPTVIELAMMGVYCPEKKQPDGKTCVYLIRTTNEDPQ
jgi:hypothetical protein